MAFKETDTRQAEADRHYDYWQRQGVPHDAIVAMLPALVAADPEARESGERWLRENATVGLDLSPQGVQEARHLAHRAKDYLTGMMEEGLFSYDPMYQPGGRYSSSTTDPGAFAERLDEASAPSGYVAQGVENATRTAHSDAEAELDRKHRFTMVDSGAPDWAAEG